MTNEHARSDDTYPDDDQPAGSMFDDVVDTIGTVVDDASDGILEWIGGWLGDSPGVFDNHSGPIAAAYRYDPWYDLPPKSAGGEGKQLGRAAPMDVTERTGVCVHQTACRFGTSSRRRRAWRQRIEDGDIDRADLGMYGIDESIDQAAQRLALHERFWRASYHWVGLLNGDVLHNNQATRYTYHGNGSNRRYLGVAAEGKLPGREQDRDGDDDEGTELFIETNRTTLRLAVENARSLGAPIEWVTAHRCWSPRRRGDPGELYWNEIVLPVASELDLQVDYDLDHNGGRPIPEDWDPDATHDWSGRAI